ncbi:hypothetical protein MYX04_05760 [Nitrospiraceae bacterium AH_259_D15_M11_P09]|nr:hypothetical protein [Nitrospiraceae bacterium AH_259_D15_M11_P09]
MSTAKAQHVILDKLSAATTALLSIHLELPDVPAWCDGVDAQGRAVLLVGRHGLGENKTVQKSVKAILNSLQADHVPEGCHAVAYAPMASAFIAEAVAGCSKEVLSDGPRGSGKTQAVPALLAALAELHARGGHALPLKSLWLHDSLTNADIKTGQSLEQPMWGGLWTLRNDRREAVLRVAGRELVVGYFVGTRDETSAERLRAECHVLAAEEAIPSLDESGGIEERKYELALTSMRLPTRRPVAVSVTNPGDVDTWPYKRFIEGGGRPGCVRCPIPASDRLTPEDVTALRAAFRDSPDLEQRLALGEWAALRLGEAVAEGFDAGVHVVSQRLVPSPDHLLAIGWDGGHSPSAVIGQVIGGQVRIYAALNDLKVGVLELIEMQVIPWLIQHAPWTRQRGASSILVHVIDPSMSTPGQATITESAEKVIRETLGGRIVKGPVAWSPRREAVLRVLAPRHEQGHLPLAINPGAETDLLVKAFKGRWFYPHTPDGRVDRSRPRKPNSPWADVGDAAAYLVGWLCGGEPMDLTPREVKVETEFDPRAPVGLLGPRF